MRRAQVGAITFICILGPVLLLLRLTQRVLVHAITICFIVAAFGGIGTWWVAKASRNRFLRYLVFMHAFRTIVGFSGLNTRASRQSVPCVTVSPINRRSGLGGIDLNKPGAKDAKVKVPEALGLVAGCMFLLCVVSFQVIYSGTFKGRWHQEGDVYEASWQVRAMTFPRLSTASRVRVGSPVMSPHTITPSSPAIAPGDRAQVEYNAGMASICFMLLLGFADDVLDIPWRIKIIMPLFASLPLLVGYSGHTAVAVPLPLRGIHVPLLGQLGDMLELGVLYKVTLMLLSSPSLRK